MCRLAEAFGVEAMYIAEENATFLDKTRFIKTARHSHKNVLIKTYLGIENLVIKLKTEDYFTLALEYCNNSKAINEVVFKKKTAILTGNERYGINEHLLNMVDTAAHINMYGKNSSMNVAQATGIALYECVNSK